MAARVETGEASGSAKRLMRPARSSSESGDLARWSNERGAELVVVIEEGDIDHIVLGVDETVEDEVRDSIEPVVSDAGKLSRRNRGPPRVSARTGFRRRGGRAGLGS